MSDERNQEQVDALCPECGQGFKAFVDRILPEDHQGHGSEATQGIACPHCGCQECKISDSVR
jgi:DNA-directed RNA polymerase subunit RPC12/RpoP